MTLQSTLVKHHGCFDNAVFWFGDDDDDDDDDDLMGFSVLQKYLETYELTYSITLTLLRANHCYYLLEKHFSRQKIC